jgi:streptogramin lyase
MSNVGVAPVRGLREGLDGFGAGAALVITARRLAGALLALLALGFAAGCGGDSADGGATADTGAAARADAGDGGRRDTARSAPDVAPGGGGADLSGAADVAADVPPGEFGARCETNEDCRSGWCVASASMGYFCTAMCVTSGGCPPDWSCRQILNTGVDAAFGCFPQGDGCAVLSPCGDCDPFCGLATVGPGGLDPFLLFGEASDGVRRAPAGELVLDSEELVLGLKYLWVANSQDDTVSQLDTHTGLEVGRYAVCDDPSRTSVDLWGNVYVGCRGDDRVAKIIVDEKLCPDRNENTFTDTSRDLDGDGRVRDNEVLPLGEDECVAWIVQPLGADLEATFRGVAVDRWGKPWVGTMWEAGERGFVVLQLDPFTGAVTREIPDLPTGVYGMALDQRGRLWGAGRDTGMLLRVDVEEDPPAVAAYMPEEICGNGHTFYGIVVDRNGRIWLGNSQCPFVYRFDPDTEQFETFAVDVDRLGYTRGIAADRDGNIVVAHHTWTCQRGNAVSVLDAETGEVRKTVSFGADGVAGPVGVAFDARGFLWSVNQCTNEALKLDLGSEQVVLRQPVGNAPYTYSDMTGYNLRTFVVPSGYYRHTFAGWPQFGTDWRRLDVTAYLPASAYLDVRVRAALTVARLQSAPWSPFLGPFPPASLPLDLRTVPGLAGAGDFIEVEVWLFAGASSPNDPPRLHRIELMYSRADEPLGGGGPLGGQGPTPGDATPDDAEAASDGAEAASDGAEAASDGAEAASE